MGEGLRSDAVLIARARDGDRNAFAALVRAHQQEVVMIAYGILQNWELAKDASQNAFVKVYFGLKQFRGDSQFKTWLFRITINETKDLLRKERSRGLFKMVQDHAGEEGSSQSILEMIPAPDDSPRAIFEMKDQKQKLEEAIKKLPEREREVFLLRYFHGLLLSEISEILNLAVGTVKAHLAHGVEKLKLVFTPSASFHQTVAQGRRVSS
ncbi:MAG: sigma-70 family RNA polymerase sigma factor [Candidatus Omnitrophica bacterium]|nr:sigma-70 family RNA polymerase sigma factor [Candidatus Omnitrophota bacterium]